MYYFYFMSPNHKVQVGQGRYACAHFREKKIMKLFGYFPKKVLNSAEVVLAALAADCYELNWDKRTECPLQFFWNNVKKWRLIYIWIWNFLVKLQWKCHDEFKILSRVVKSSRNLFEPEVASVEAILTSHIMFEDSSHLRNHSSLWISW